MELDNKITHNENHNSIHNFSIILNCLISSFLLEVVTSEVCKQIIFFSSDVSNAQSLQLERHGYLPALFIFTMSFIPYLFLKRQFYKNSSTTTCLIYLLLINPNFHLFFLKCLLVFFLMLNDFMPVLPPYIFILQLQLFAEHFCDMLRQCYYFYRFSHQSRVP